MRTVVATRATAAATRATAGAAEEVEGAIRALALEADRLGEHWRRKNERRVLAVLRKPGGGLRPTRLREHRRPRRRRQALHLELKASALPVPATIVLVHDNLLHHLGIRPRERHTATGIHVSATSVIPFGIAVSQP
eukprot:scaffold44890_cov60-Phaeocystis_antarctica.AAC.1